jgi:5-epi-alpha-selinene synthase
MESFLLPQLTCPFASAINPHAALVHQHTLDWVQRFALVHGDTGYQWVGVVSVGELAARAHPHASREALELISNWYAWMFFRDDQCDESAIGRYPERLTTINTRFLEILGGAPKTDLDGPLAHALHDLRERIERQVTPTWLRRFTRTVKEYFASTVWEATNRARNFTPDVATYIRMRPLTGGLAIDTEFIEIVEQTHLPPEVRSHPVVRALTTASNNVVCWANDLISLEKEVKCGDVHNLVLVLRHAYQLTLQQAIDHAAQMYNREIAAFLELETQLPSFGTAVDANLRRYLSVLCARMRGNLDWSYATTRYRMAAPTLRRIVA